MSVSVLVALLCLVLGLAVGSFLNVVVWRVPRKESVVHPPSACPRCGHGIRWFDNIPVLSWFVLRGRCRDCREPISWRYPAVEASTGLLFAGVGLHFGLSAALPAFLYLGAISVALLLIDLDTHTLPNAIVLPAYPVTVGLLLLATWVEGEWWSLARAGIGAAILFGAYLLMAVAYAGGMGFGDVKLAGVLGAYLGWLGWGQLAVGAFGAFLLGGLFGIALVLSKKAGRKTGIPFGPWMITGAFLGIFAGGPLWDSYLGLVN